MRQTTPTLVETESTLMQREINEFQSRNKPTSRGASKYPAIKL